MVEDEVYRLEGFKDRNAYLNWLAANSGVNSEVVYLYADIIGPEGDFDQLPKVLDEEYARKSHVPVRYRYSL